MKRRYYPDTASFYVEFRTAPSVKTHEVADGLNLDLDAEGNVVGFDIDHASHRQPGSAASVAKRWRRHLFSYDYRAGTTLV